MYIHLGIKLVFLIEVFKLYLCPQYHLHQELFFFSFVMLDYILDCSGEKNILLFNLQLNFSYSNCLFLILSNIVEMSL